MTARACILVLAQHRNAIDVVFVTEYERLCVFWNWLQRNVTTDFLFIIGIFMTKIWQSSLSHLPKNCKFIFMTMHCNVRVYKSE